MLEDESDFHASSVLIGIGSRDASCSDFARVLDHSARRFLQQVQLFLSEVVYWVHARFDSDTFLRSYQTLT